MLPDLLALRDQLLAGASSARAEIERSLAYAASTACSHAFIQIDAQEARVAAAQADMLPTRQPLAGLAVSIKDLFDVAGQRTRAGSVVLNDAPAATRDAVAVQRLRAAGAALIGRTNMSEFAFSGVGVNPHFGTPLNPADRRTARVPGGSSSGAAVSVATGAAHIGLGSDTGGSLRIPAALVGLVGFKSTARLVPTTGALPLSTTLDTVGAITRSVRDTILAHEVLSARTVQLAGRAPSGLRFAVAKHWMLDGMDAPTSRAFERALEHLSRAGATIVELALDELAALSSINAKGGFPAAEAHAWHRSLLNEHAKHYDPRVRTRIERGAAMLAADYIDLYTQRAAWIESVLARIEGFDAVLSPTVPIVAPVLEEVAPGAERDAEFFRVNALLLRNPSVVNMLDGCAISLPCHAEGDLPAGLMLWHGAMRDDQLLDTARAIERLLQAGRPAAQSA